MTQPTGRTADGMWIAATESIRDAIGSNDNAQVGDRCLTLVGDAGHADNEIDVLESVDGGDASTWSRFRKQYYTGAFQEAVSTDLRYVPVHGSVVERTSGDVFDVKIPCRYDGRVIGITASNQDVTAGSSEFGFHKGPAGGIPSGTPSETQTIVVAAADTPYHMVFSGTGPDDNAYAKDEIIAFSIDPTGIHDEWTYVIEIENNLLT